MDSDDTTDDSGQNLMHKKNDEICIVENAKVTQHDPDFENANVGDDEEHLNAPRLPILAGIFQRKMLVLVRAKIYSECIQGIGLALHLPHLTATV